MDPKMKAFLARFRFDPARVGHIGIERESMLMQGSAPVPRAAEFLRLAEEAGSSGSWNWKYELSACQVETTTSPLVNERDILDSLVGADAEGDALAARLGLRLLRYEVGPENMPLDVYPDPRYSGMAEKVGEERLRSACRVMGTHIHIGCGSLAEALEAYHRLIPYLGMFCEMGDGSNGERLRLYKSMAPEWKPEPYASEEDFFAAARADGFEKNPRNCHRLVRINPVGTVEVRAFGLAGRRQVMEWVREVRACSGISRK